MRGMQAEAPASHPGTPAGPHTGEHSMAQPDAHDCCDRDGLTGPRCCAKIQTGPKGSPAMAARAGDVAQLAAVPPARFGLAAAVVRRERPRRFDPEGPPGTLIRQHTSLLV